MSGGNVCVLALNGRRQTVKCTPNMTILQILEEVCKKQNLNAEEFDLKHHNKILDTTTIFRFSGLPNNAQLELVAARKVRSESEIILAINLENGDRLIGNFSPNVTLLNILNQLCPESVSPEKNPVVIYTRREIYGKELDIVTLKSLGLTGGRAMIRLIHRSPEDLKVQANVAVPLPSKPAEEKPYQRKFQPLSSYVRQEEPADKTEMINNNRVMIDDTNLKQIKNKGQKNANVDILKLAREKRKSIDFDTPKKDDKRKNPTEKYLDDAKEKKIEACECSRDESMEVDCCGKCKEKCTNIVQQGIEDEFVFLGDRNAMLFSLESAQAVPSEELPDDFFELTIDDARKILRDVKKQRFNMESTPLMTSTLRNLEDSKKQLMQLNRYKKAIIRIQFPDRAVLQGTFSPTDTVAEVIEFVREYLEEKSAKFYIYSTPPKCVLDENKRLIELGFVPGAMVYFGTDILDTSSFLRKDLQGKFTSNSVASLAAAKMRSENTRSCRGLEVEDDIEMETSPSIITNDGASTSTGLVHDNYGERKIIRSTENVPKWFKP